MNIYLLEDPVIINAIEYNKSFRHIDVLNEVALLCVDLDVPNEPRLSERFFQSYLQAWGEKEEDLSRKVLL